MIPTEVLVVGSSAAGLTTMEALRRKGYDGKLVMLGAERGLPYDRPPLSKQVLSGDWEPDRSRLRSAEALTKLDVGFMLGDPAVGLDVGTRTVRTTKGRLLRAQAVVVATGLRPRELPGQQEFAGVHVLRSLKDSLALRADLSAANSVVVVGDGVLGAEIAATARGMGLAVTLTGPQSAPLAAQLGPLVSGVLADLHRDNGVELRLGSAVTAVTGSDGRASGVRLDTGEELPAEVVVVALGAEPVTDWLTDSGLLLDDGIVCDSHCRAADGIYAAGDVARWHHNGLGRLLRLENRTNATEQGVNVASNILGEDKPYTPIPYYWSDQFDAKIHVHGTLPDDADVSIVDGSVADRRFVAAYRDNDIVTGVVGWNMPKQARQQRTALIQQPIVAAR